LRHYVATTVESSEAGGPLVRSSICLVDDDPSLRDSVSNLLNSVGFEVAVFESAETFLASEIFARTGCLVLDLRLQGMNGLDLMSHLNAVAQAVPTIVLTGHGDEVVRRQALALGASAFLTKPFRARELIAAIRVAIAAAPESPA
jgi:FixJ family two-component response regulator